MTSNNKLNKQLELTNEQTSPLFRIMWIQNRDEPHRRHFENNICAFHIGNGFILSVAHNLKVEANIFKSIGNVIYLTNIFPYLNSEQAQFFESCYPLEPGNQKRYANIANPNDHQSIISLLKQINFDSRWITLMDRKICRPHLVIQFKNNLFFNKPELSAHFNPTTYFAEPGIQRHTFNTPAEVINAMPSLEVDYSLLDDDQQHYYCLQSSPTSEIGKLLNKAQIDGFTEHFSIFQERFGGNYNLEGLRYLIKGYFRFGSSGAPYVVYDESAQKFRVNAIQSEACPIQLSINNQRDGNFQYVNAIASPLQIIRERLEKHLQV